MTHKHGASSFNEKHQRRIPPPSSCVTGKVAYSKLRQAKRAADKLRRAAAPGRQPELHAYECVHCGRFHLSTHSPRAPHLQRQSA